MTNPFDRPARPFDLFNKALGRVETEVASERMAVCRECPMFNLGVCGECHCFMPLKTKLPNAECPLHKWGQVRVLDTEPQRILVILDGTIVDIVDADDRLSSILLSQPTLVGVPRSTEVKIGDTYA